MHVKRLTLLEPDYVATGHYRIYAAALAALCRRDGIALRIAVPFDTPSELVDEARAFGAELLPVFGAHLVRRLHVRALSWTANGVEVAAVATRLMRGAAPSERFGTFSGRVEVAAGARAAAELTRRPFVLHTYGWIAPGGSGPAARLNAAFFSATLAAVRRGSRHFTIIAQTRPLAEHLRHTLGIPVAAIGMSFDWDTYPAAPLNPPPPVVGFLGDVRAEKGFERFVEAVTTIDPGVDVIAQAHAPRIGMSASAKAALERLKARDSAHTTVFEQPLTNAEYLDLLGRIGILVMPYAVSEYVNRTSNLVAEALGMGIVPVVPEGTWLAEVVRERGVGVIYDATRPGALRDAVDDALRRYPELAARSAAAIGPWRAQNRVQDLLDGLLGFAPARTHA